MNWQWVSEFTPGAAGIWAIAAMLIVHFSRHWLATRKLSIEDRVALREGYSAQVTHLTSENRALHTDLSKLRKEYDEYRQLCQTETQQLRDMLRHNEDEISGLKRKIDDQAIRITKLLREKK